MSAPPRARFYPLTVTAVERLTEAAVAISLMPPPAIAPLFRFLPGQHVILRRVIAGEELRRSYSLCSEPDEPALRIAVKRIPTGRFSTWVTEELAPGDTIDAMPPQGSFVFRPDPAAERVVLGLAAGAGITPILGIAKALLAREPASRFVLLYGNRTAAEVMFRAELADLKDRYLARFTLLHVLSREASALAALEGRLDEAKLVTLLPGIIAPPLITAAYLCGPPGFPEGASRALTALGVPAERVHVERFLPPEAWVLPPAREGGAAALAARLRITYDGKTREVPMAAGETVLEAGLRAGLELPWSCRAGMCCSCRARLTAGAVAMARNYSLEPWEVAAGFILTCQSRAETDFVAVDYDAV